MTRIAICGVAHSQNLGDGVIAESLQWLLQETYADIEVVTIDLSGRTEAANVSNTEYQGTNSLRAVHQALMRISLYRQGNVFVHWHMGRYNGVRNAWREQITNCDLVIIGGGQLLMDNFLSFPLRIRELVQIARVLNKRVVFFACGVSKKWSRLGLHILSQALLHENITQMSVRDNESLHNLQTLFPHAEFECNISFDPAICAAEAYQLETDSRSNLIGLGISAPNQLIHQVHNNKELFCPQRFRQFWVRLAELLIADNQPFVFFTNGNPEDNHFADGVLAVLSRNTSITPQLLLWKPDKPRSLVAQIARCQAIIAHRLHANIIAYSLGIPSVGLIWDKKVKEFGAMTGRSPFYLEPNEMEPKLVKNCLDQAIKVGVDMSRLANDKASVHKSVQAMLKMTNIEPNGAAGPI